VEDAMKKLVVAALSMTFAPLCLADAAAQNRLTASPHQTATGTAVSGFAAEARVAYVDVERVASLSSEGKALAAKLQDLRAKKSAEVTERSKAVEALQSKLAQTGSVLDEVVRLRLEREFQRAQLDFQRFTADAQAEVQDAQQEILRTFNSRVFPIIGEIAREKKLWAVFGSENLLWYSPEVDLTQEVAARLDATAAPAKR
jgi:outer membrane protein